MSSFTLLFILNFLVHTLLLIGGVFLGKKLQILKNINNDLTSFFKRGNMQSTKILNEDFFLDFGGFC